MLCMILKKYLTFLVSCIYFTSSNHVESLKEFFTSGDVALERFLQEFTDVNPESIRTFFNDELSLKESSDGTLLRALIYCVILTRETGFISDEKLVDIIYKNSIRQVGFSGSCLGKKNPIGAFLASCKNKIINASRPLQWPEITRFAIQEILRESFKESLMEYQLATYSITYSIRYSYRARENTPKPL
jgi:hypothetical protein